MKSSSKEYITFLVVFFLIFSFFIIYPHLSGDQRQVRSENYNVSFTIQGYVAKINNAVYHTDKQTLSFDLNVKKEYETEDSEPQITQIISEGSSHELEFDIFRETDFKSRVTVYGVESDFYYVRIKLTSTSPDVTPPPEIDEFGDVITYPVEKGEETASYVYIDYRNVTFIKSKQSAPAEQTTVTTLSSKVTNSGSVTTTAPPETEAATTTTVTVANVVSEKKTTTTTKVTTTAKKPDEKVTTTTPHTANSTVTTVKKTEPKKTTTTVKKATTTTKKATSATTTKRKTTTTTTKRKSTTTTTTKKVVTTTTSLVPIPLRGLALKTDSPDNTVYIKVGDTTKVTPIFTPAQATNKKVTWSSNREDRAIVDKNGVVTGRSPGAVIIKCVSDDGGLSAACMIVVTE